MNAVPTVKQAQQEMLQGTVFQIPSIPLMHWERFAELVGVESGVIRGMADRGHLPSLVIGRHRFINLALLTQRCLQTAA